MKLTLILEIPEETVEKKLADTGVTRDELKAFLKLTTYSGMDELVKIIPGAVLNTTVE